MYLRAGGRKTGAIRPNREKNTWRESSQWEVGVSTARMIKAMDFPEKLQTGPHIYTLCVSSPLSQELQTEWALSSEKERLNFLHTK